MNEWCQACHRMYYQDKCPTCMAKAERGRDEALALLEATRKTYLIEARVAAVKVAIDLRRPITVNDVRKIAPPPEEIDGRVMGSVFKGKDSPFEPVGYTASERAHARPIMRFRYTGDMPDPVQMGLI